MRAPGRIRAPLAALVAAAALACDDDTTVVVAVGEPLPPGAQPPAGGAVIVVTHVDRNRDASATRLADTAIESAASRRSGPAGRVHADALFLPSPRGAARITADDHAVAADPGTGGKNYDDDTNVDFGRDVAARHAFLRVGLGHLPRRARILDAHLEILARFGDAQPGCEVYVGVVPRDGRWNDRARGLQWGRAPSFDGIVRARDADGTSLATTALPAAGASNFGILDTNDRGAEASSREVGQTLTTTREGTLADVQVQLRRAGVLEGATRLRVERCRADDGSDDRPDGVPLAVSLPVDASAIGSGVQGSLVTYVFAQGPLLVAGGRYAFVLESDAQGSAEHHLQWKIQHGDAYRAGGLVNLGRKIAWNVVAYPELSQLPFFFGEDLVTPRAPPFGTLSRVEVPPFPAPDVWVDVADVTAQLQEWVDDPSYVPRDVLAIELFTARDTPPGALRRGKDFRLRVTWREPRAR